MKKKLLIIVIIIIIVLITLVFSLRKEKEVTKVITGFVGTTEKAVLRLSPSSGGYQVGETFQVNILLDTNGYQTAGVDIHYLRYPSNLLEVQDALSNVGGVQITPGNLFANTNTNLVNQSAGQIDFSQTSTGGTTFRGSGTLATISFKVLAQGTAQVNFDFTLGLTTDTNIASAGLDVLSGVENSVYTLVSDATPPAAISDLRATDLTLNSLKLIWTAPGDDGNTGTATSYDLRYSTSNITQSNWSSATQVTGEPAPQLAGTTQNMTISGLSGYTTYYFAIKSTDDRDNVSSLSNVVSAKTQQAKSFKIKIKPEGRTSFSNIQVKILILYPGTENTASEDQGLTDSEGARKIDLTQFAQNTYDIRVIVPYYLQKKRVNLTLTPPETTVDFIDILAGNLQDVDNVINSLDWSVMNSQWARTDRPASDINQDGIVNSLDWSWLNKNWGLRGD